MATIEIEGVGEIEVDDSFVKLPAAEQSRAVDEITNTLKEKKPSLFGNVIPDMLAQGVTAGYSDEIEAGVKTGFGFLGDYDAEVGQIRDRMQQGREEYPILSTVSEIAGGVALPGGAAMRGANMAQKIARGAAVGGGYGAAYGSGQAEGGVENRLAGGAEGAVMGAAAGGLAPVAIGALKGGAQAVQGAYNRANRPFAGAIGVEREAQKRIGNAARYEQLYGDSGLSEAEFLAAKQRGQPVAVADMAGRSGGEELRRAANFDPEAWRMADNLTRERGADQTKRTIGFLRTIVPGIGRSETRRKLQAAAQRENSKFYRKAYKAGDKPINSPELERLMSSPEIRDAMKKVAEKSGKDMAVAEGYGGFNAGVKVTDDGQIVFQRGKDGVPQYPNLQFWDYVKRELDRRVKSPQKSEGTPTYYNLIGQLRDELDRLVPEYAAAREKASGFFADEDALEAGKKFLNFDGDLNEAKRAFNQLPAGRRALLREGLISQMIEDLRGLRSSRDMLVTVFQDTPKLQETLRVVLKPSQINQLEAFMHVERVMQDVNKVVQGGSHTARYLGHMSEAVQGAGAGAALAALTPLDYGASMIAGALVNAGRGEVNRRVARQFARMATSSSPQAATKAAQLAARNPKLLESLRLLELPAVVGTVQTGTRSDSE